MRSALIDRFLSRQFAEPSGAVGQWLIGPWLDRIARPMNRAAFEALDVGPGEKVLEVGFGGGDLVEWLLRAGEAQVVGIDRSEAMLKRARRRFRTEVEEGRVELLQGLAEALPLNRRSVDKAVSVNGLYFWPDLPAALAELARVLRRGGHLVLCFQAPVSVRAWPGHVHGFTAYGAEEVADVMSKAGFERIRTRAGEGKKVGEFICMSGQRDG